MKFGEFPVYEAVGVELSHPVNCQGHIFKKGRILTDGDISLLRGAGIKKVTGALYAATDVHKQTAADVLLKTMIGDYLRYTLPTQDGFSDFFADTDGVLIFEPERLKRLNAHSEDICVSAVLPFTPVFKGQFIGNLRLNGPAVDADVLNEAVTKISGTGSLFKIAPYAFCKIAYIRTVTDTENIQSLDPVEIDKRFGMYGFDVIFHDLCAHESEAVEKAVRNAMDANAEIVLVESPIAPAHREDIVPKGFAEASADIDRLGWPIDDAPSVVIAHRNETVLIGFGQADAQKQSVDRLLRLLATRSLPTPDLLPDLAVGGLSFLRMAQRITPEQEQNSVGVGAIADSEKIAVVILAAGSSRRMFGSNKLLETIDGLPMVEKVVQSALSSKAQYVTVVTGYQANLIEKKLLSYDVKIVRNADYEAGVLGSARLGLSVLPPDIVGAVVLPADMPAFDEDRIDDLIDLFDFKAKRPPVCVPSYKGIRSNPVLWPRDLFGDVKIVPEDAHWTPALIEHSDYIKELVLADALPLTDINTKGDLENYQEQTQQVAEAEQSLFELEQGLLKQK